jgi:hypothetical protein
LLVETDPPNVHRLILLHGREQARQMVDVKTRPLVDIAAEVMADESQRIGISYTGFCLTSLPHKRLPDDQTWEKKGYRVTLWVEPGRMKTRGQPVTYGVPYGARARMILLYLQTQAVRSGSREVALGRSMRDWMERMGLSIGGETARSLREQAARISACTLKFFWEDDEREEWARGAIVTSGLRFKVPEDAQGNLWEDRVVLDEVFWKAAGPPGAAARGGDQATARSLDEPRHLCLVGVALPSARQADLDLVAGRACPIRRRVQGHQALQAKLPGGAGRRCSRLS